MPDCVRMLASFRHPIRHATTQDASVHHAQFPLAMSVTLCTMFIVSLPTFAQMASAVAVLSNLMFVHTNFSSTAGVQGDAFNAGKQCICAIWRLR